MSPQQSILSIKAKAINKLKKVVHPEYIVGYCWQEETRDEVLNSLIGEILHKMDVEISNTKAKYRRLEASRKTHDSNNR